MVTEQQLKLALSAVYDQRLDAEIAALEAGETPTIPARQEQKLLKMLAKLDRQYQNGTLLRRQSVSGRRLRRALLIAALLILLLLAAVFASAVIQRQMQIDGGFVEVMFPKTAGRDRLDASFGEIPAGFELVEKNKENTICRYVFQRGDNRLVIISRKGSSVVVFDMDGLTPQTIDINGQTADLCFSDSVINLAWSTGGITRNILVDRASGVTVEELIKIAQSFEE